jgi:hypothetical protein
MSRSREYGADLCDVAGMRSAALALGLFLMVSAGMCTRRPEPPALPPETGAPLDAGVQMDGGVGRHAEASAGDAASVPADATAPAVIEAGSPGLADAGAWRPARKTSWQWQLQGRIDTSVDVEMYDVDLFDVAPSTVDALRREKRVVICYFSAGSREPNRPDVARIQPSEIGKSMAGWPGERWLDVRSKNIREIMRARLDLAVKKRCDGVEPDNVDGYDNETGFDLRAGDQIDFNAFLADEAHRRGLSVGLKNAGDLAAKLEPRFDWALNEECVSKGECKKYRTFLAAGKQVFHVEYVERMADAKRRLADICGRADTQGFSTLVKLKLLGPERAACP